MSSETTQKKTAGAFDIRNVIGALLGVFGIVLLLAYAFGSDSANGGSNSSNLSAGIIFLVVGVVFVAWALLRPIVVDESGDKPKGSSVG